ncbi:acyltransferase, partial [Rhodococcus hoagii]|nr:acyltransferase [Prescottella equi]
MRFAGVVRDSAGRSLALGVAVTAAGVCACLLMLLLRPVPVGHGAAAAALAVSAPTTTESVAADPDDVIVGRLTSQVQAAVAASAGADAVPSNLSPPLGDAPASKPGVFLNGCVRSWLEVGQDECASGDVASPSTVALVGDSHAAMWTPALEPVAEQRHW